MMFRMNGPVRIDNLRHYPAATVERLRSLLTQGAMATADPRRKNFYDLEAEEGNYYIHVSPTGTVLLLARWQRTPALQDIRKEMPVGEAMACC